MTQIGLGPTKKPRRVSVGHMRITLLDGGELWLDGGAMFGIIPKPLWSKRVEVDDANRVPLSMTCFLLESGGNIVNTSSTSALAGLAYGAAYGASKAGVLGLTYSLAIEYGRRGVRANAVCPGSIKTPMTAGAAGLPEKIDPKLITRAMALDKPRGPETVAGVIAMLASDDGAHINGVEIRVDGGTLS